MLAGANARATRCGWSIAPATSPSLRGPGGHRDRRAGLLLGPTVKTCDRALRVTARGSARSAQDRQAADPRARGPRLARSRWPAPDRQDAAEGVRRERWTYAELAEAVGMSESQAHAILAGADLRPHLTERWVMSELAAGLRRPGRRGLRAVPRPAQERDRHLARREDLDRRAQPHRRDRRPRRRAGRRGVTASSCATAPPICSPRCAFTPARRPALTAPTRNRWDFRIAFLEQLEGRDPAGRRVIAILDNLSTHKTSRGQRLAGRAPALATGLHPHRRLLAQPGRDLLLDPRPARAAPRPVTGPDDLPTRCSLVELTTHHHVLAHIGKMRPATTSEFPTPVRAGVKSSAPDELTRGRARFPRVGVPGPMRGTG